MPQYQKATLVNKIDCLNVLCLSHTAKGQYECLNKKQVVSKRKTHLAKIERSLKPDIYLVGT